MDATVLRNQLVSVGFDLHLSHFGGVIPDKLNDAECIPLVHVETGDVVYFHAPNDTIPPEGATRSTIAGLKATTVRYLPDAIKRGVLKHPLEAAQDYLEKYNKQLAPLNLIAVAKKAVIDKSQTPFFELNRLCCHESGLDKASASYKQTLTPKAQFISHTQLCPDLLFNMRVIEHVLNKQVQAICARHTQDMSVFVPALEKKNLTLKEQGKRIVFDRPDFLNLMTNNWYQDKAVALRDLIVSVEDIATGKRTDKTKHRNLKV